MRHMKEYFPGIRGVSDVPTSPSLAPCRANRWPLENLDNAQTGLHDYFMYLKYGFGRGCQQISVDVRSGRVSREEALEWVEKYDGTFPDDYAGIPLSAVLDRIGMTRKQLDEVMRRFCQWGHR